MIEKAFRKDHALVKIKIISKIRLNISHFSLIPHNIYHITQMKKDKNEGREPWLSILMAT